MQLIDLGLPSGTLWADRNVGARTPYDDGLYVSWGNNYGYSADQAAQCTEEEWQNSPGGSVQESRLQGGPTDPATAIMGDGWVTPTASNYEELFNETYTDIEWVSINGRGMMRVTSKVNGNILYIPCAGYIVNGALSSNGNFCLMNTMTWQYGDEEAGCWANLSKDDGTSLYGDADWTFASVRAIQLNV